MPPDKKGRHFYKAGNIYIFIFLLSRVQDWKLSQQVFSSTAPSSPGSTSGFFLKNCLDLRWASNFKLSKNMKMSRDNRLISLPDTVGQHKRLLAFFSIHQIWPLLPSRLEIILLEGNLLTQVPVNHNFALWGLHQVYEGSDLFGQDWYIAGSNLEVKAIQI